MKRQEGKRQEGKRHEGKRQENTSHEAGQKKHTRWLYARVLIVQVITLIALYWLQAAYGGG